MPGHDSLSAEARALLEVLEHKLGTAAATPPAAEHDSVRCTGCPICVALTYLKDHRELSAQLAQGALLIVAALRQYLDQPGAPRSTAHPTPGGPTAPSATVQHIDIS